MNDVQVTAGTDQALGELTLPSSSGTQTGILRISLTDALGDFDAVNITPLLKSALTWTTAGLPLTSTP